jgi:hypothetical protein
VHTFEVKFPDGEQDEEDQGKEEQGYYICNGGSAIRLCGVMKNLKSESQTPEARG